MALVITLYFIRRSEPAELTKQHPPQSPYLATTAGKPCSLHSSINAYRGSFLKQSCLNRHRPIPLSLLCTQAAGLYEVQLLIPIHRRLLHPNLAVTKPAEGARRRQDLLYLVLRSHYPKIYLRLRSLMRASLQQQACLLLRMASMIQTRNHRNRNHRA